MLSLDFSKGHAYNRLVLPVKRGKKDEVFETIQCYFAALLFRRAFAQADSPADTCQRIRTCAYADSPGNRNFEDSPGEGSSGFSYRNYACHVYSGWRRSVGGPRRSFAGVDSGSGDYGCDYRVCYGGYRTGDSGYDSEREEVR